MRWEYKCGQITDVTKVQTALNAYGDDGWELIAASFVDAASSGPVTRLILKRPREIQEPSPGIEI